MSAVRRIQIILGKAVFTVDRQIQTVLTEYACKAVIVRQLETAGQRDAVLIHKNAQICFTVCFVGAADAAGILIRNRFIFRRS